MGQHIEAHFKCGRWRSEKQSREIHIRAIYITGNVADYPNPINVYRCDDFNGMNTTMTWTPLDNIKLSAAKDRDVWRAILEVYGTVYIGTGSSGYLVGTMT